ncbi:MAG: rim15, signal transduction response regulator [Cirrosporium novae-zelandiae]|nr:MAG: rim15, signal transduction response regulator [Cirrosporium novae-zelandiae]
MAKDGVDQTFLAPPAITALKQEAVDLPRGQMQRTLSEDIREEREDLKEAAEHTLNLILDLELDGTIRWVSPSWEDVIGTPAENVIGKNVAEIVQDNKTVFADAVESMKQDDSRSQIIHFSVRLGPQSVLRSDPTEQAKQVNEEEACEDEESEEGNVMLEGQGIMVYDRSSEGESHTMWMVRPAPKPREITIDLPPVLVESLGVGAEMLANYLTALAEVGASDPANHPPPLPILCRICERQITPWWFEKHTELCLQEHKAEMEVQLAQEALTDHRNAIVRVLDALEARRSRTPAPEGSTATATQVAEYKGLPIGASASTPSGGSSSGSASPASGRGSRDSSTARGGHARARSFAVRRPLPRITELVLDLCDTALSISTPAIKETRMQTGPDFRTLSPSSDNQMTQVMNWQSPTTLEQEPGLALLCSDTEQLSKAKVDAVDRHMRILEYSERIRMEFDVLVQECIDEAMKKAARIAAGQLSDSTESEEDLQQEVEQEQEQEQEHEQDREQGSLSRDELATFSASLEGSTAMASALKNMSEHALHESLATRTSSAALSTRSSSPMECPTPRSHVSGNLLTKKALENDDAASDSSAPSSVLSNLMRTESPDPNLGGLSRSRTGSSRDRERKRRSLKLTGIISPGRQQSPIRPAPPGSPLRMNKPRVPSGPEFQSPITSPLLPTTEFSSPAVITYRHRRQSSAASSDMAKPPPSPRLGSVSHPQSRPLAPSIKDFEIIKPISKGAFGSVYLSKKKSTGDYFAIKVLKKADMVAKNQVTNVKAERAIMMWQGESDFVAKLYWTFASKDYLYLVMEYLNGGDCASLVKVLGGLPEDWAKKYLAEVVLGVENLHGKSIIHRDLKPDNLLIDQKGHLKLTDFGLSRMGLVGRQKRLQKSPNESQPDLLKQGPFPSATSKTPSRSASFDFQGGHSPTSTPLFTPDMAAPLVQPSYFNLNRDDSITREHSRKASDYRSDSGGSDQLHALFRNLSMSESNSFSGAQKGLSIEEECHSEGSNSPDPYTLQPTTSHISITNIPTQPNMIPPMALFDPDDNKRRFVGTPDYLAPETIKGDGQDETSDWWSLGCILFEFLYGYPPFHADTPDQVFENILNRNIDWPSDEDCPVSPEAKDLINKLMTVDPHARLGANEGDKFSSGGEEVRSHPWFNDINWETLREDEAQFVPNLENPEDTEYFDARGATLQSFAEELEDQMSPQNITPGADYPDRPHDALSRVRTQVNVNSMRRGLMPLHIPAHVRDGRSRRLSEPVMADDFGNFTYKNLPVLEKANKDVIQKLRAEAMLAQSKTIPSTSSTGPNSPTPSLESSPMLPGPLKRTLSTNKGHVRPASPSNLSQANSSPNRMSQPSSPLLVSFSTGNHERRKTSSASSTLSHQSSSGLQAGSMDIPRQAGSFKVASNAASPMKPSRLAGMPGEKGPVPQRQTSNPTPRARSQTVSSQEGEQLKEQFVPGHYKRRSQIFDISPSSSDNEDPRAKALLRVQRRRQSSRRMSQITLLDGPAFRPLDVLICEDHPVSRMVMERLLEKLRCRTITAANGSEAMRYAMSDIQFDVILMEYKLPQVNGADVARMIRDTKNANSQTPLVAVTGYLKELPENHHFDMLLEKPPTLTKLTDALSQLCMWKPPSAAGNAIASSQPLPIPHSSLRQQALRLDDSPSSTTSSFPALVGGGSYHESSHEDSLGSSFFGEMENVKGEDVPVIISRQGADEWSNNVLGITDETTGEVKPMFQPVMPKLLQTTSAPPVVGPKTPRRARSRESIQAKRVSIEQQRHECAESGDDEDDELGDIQVRTRSPQVKVSRGSSRLGTEMMRTNSHGSVISGYEEDHPSKELSTPPSTIPPETSAKSKMTPPEMLRKELGEKLADIDMDTTPRPPSNIEMKEDDEPTPRPKSSLSKRTVSMQSDKKS